MPKAQSEAMAAAVRARGLPVAYLLFAHEQHGFRRAENICRALEAELYFYGKVLGFEPADRIEPVEIANLPADGPDTALHATRPEREKSRRGGPFLAPRHSLRERDRGRVARGWRNRMKALWHTLWQGHDIAVCRDSVEVDRFSTQQIERVLLLHRGSGDSPGDVVQVVIELPDHCLVFSADTGIAGRINFERQSFWAERGCVHWVNIARAPLPLRLRTGSRPAAPVAAAVRARRAGRCGRPDRQVAGAGRADLGRAQAPAHRARPAVELRARLSGDAPSRRTLPEDRPRPGFRFRRA